ncbi:MAG TPA: metallophosphoesterase, partial [Sphingomonas sp.]
MVPFSFAGHAFAALPQGALYWPARRALLVADLHFEKASWFARAGQMLPPYDSVATLADLAAIVAATQPAEIWSLGDSFHDSAGCDRLPERARAMLADLTDRHRWIWITGNHDRDLVDRCGGEVMAEAVVDGVVLRHEADPAEHRPELS